MVILQETTVYTDGQNGNHIYIFKSKPEGRSAEAVAYVPRGSDKVVKFRKPLKLDLKGRTFSKVD
jgi:hypothetical protein